MTFPVTDSGGRVYVFVTGRGNDGDSLCRLHIVANDGRMIPVQDRSPLTSSLCRRAAAGFSAGQGPGLCLNFTGDSNVTYSVWASVNLTNWVRLGTAQQPDPGQFQYNDGGATNLPARYYQVRSP